jgi:hypothetical protein
MGPASTQPGYAARTLRCAPPATARTSLNRAVAETHVSFNAGSCRLYYVARMKGGENQCSE